MNLSAVVQGVVTVLGIWLMAAPSLLDYAGAPAANHHRFVGPLVASFAFLAMSAITRGLRWLNVACALWLLVAPFVVDGFPGQAVVVSVVTGAAVLGLAPIGRPEPDRFGGGWRSLWDEDAARW